MSWTGPLSMWKGELPINKGNQASPTTFCISVGWSLNHIGIFWESNQGASFRLMFSYLELTQDYVLQRMYMLWFLAFAISAIKFNVLNHLVDRDCFESWTLYFKSPSFPCSPISSYSPYFLYVILLRMAGWNFLEYTYSEDGSYNVKPIRGVGS